jgi:hypothetical protein
MSGVPLDGRSAAQLTAALVDHMASSGDPVQQAWVEEWRQANPVFQAQASQAWLALAPRAAPVSPLLWALAIAEDQAIRPGLASFWRRHTTAVRYRVAAAWAGVLNPWLPTEVPAVPC